MVGARNRRNSLIVGKLGDREVIVLTMRVTSTYFRLRKHNRTFLAVCCSRLPRQDSKRLFTAAIFHHSHFQEVAKNMRNEILRVLTLFLKLGSCSHDSGTSH